MPRPARVVALKGRVPTADGCFAINSFLLL